MYHVHYLMMCTLSYVSFNGLAHNPKRYIVLEANKRKFCMKYAKNTLFFNQKFRVIKCFIWAHLTEH